MTIALSTLDGANGFRLDGIDSDDESGRSVASAGDVNGDGYDDFIIGTHGGDPDDVTDAGESYVVFGKAGGFDAAIDLAALNGTDGFRLDGVAGSDRSGWSVASAGDVNGDGFADVIIGALYGGYGEYSSVGQSYVVFGKASGFLASLDLASLDGANGFRLDGLNSADRVGTSVASAGDVNGDGYDDFIIGAPRADPGADSAAGSSYVVFGKASGFDAAFDLTTLDGTNGFRLDGIDSLDASGRSVASAGDVNGDGFADLIIGAPGLFTPANESYVVFGKAGGFDASLDLSTLDGFNGFKLAGIDADDQSGLSVASAGDVNGDGFDDLLIGARGADPGGNSSAGESYVVFGKTSGFGASFNLASLDGTNGFRLDGFDPDDFSGGSVSSAGDVNGDGFDDVIVGADRAYGGGFSSGESYVVFGKVGGFDAAIDLSTLDSTNGFRIQGVDDFDFSGFSVSAAGDVNGDGFSDLLIGAYAADPNDDSRAGKSYVIFGSDTIDGATSAVTHMGTDGDDPLTGTGGRDVMIGGRGGDTLDGGAPTVTGGFEDVFYGASGDDRVLLRSLSFGRVDGGTGRDTLDLSGVAFSDTLFVTDENFRKVSGMEVLALGDLSGLYADITVGPIAGDGFDGPRVEIDGSAAVDGTVILRGGGMLKAVDIDFSASTGRRDITAGAGDDWVRSGASHDRLDGAGGDDTLEGGQGGDSLDGGGNDAVGDTASYANSTSGSGIAVDLGNAGAQTGPGDASGDTLSGIENLLGSAGADTLIGDGDVNVLDGGEEADSLRGEGGEDQLIGGEGDDTLLGGDDDDTLVGGAGTDSLVGGAGGDRLEGGGDDIASYAGSAAGVTVDLTLTGAQTSGGDASNDTLAGVGNIGGSSHADTLLGDGDNNALTGGEGRDELDGAGGDDELYVAAGETALGEIYDGGTGTDELYVSGALVDFTGSTLTSLEALGFGAAAARVVFTSDQIGAGLLSLTLAVEADDFSNQLVVNMRSAGALDLSGWTFELWDAASIDEITVNGSTGNDTIIGTVEEDAINAGDGHDLIVGTGEDFGDLIDGEGGNDTVSYAASGEAVRISLLGNPGNGGTAEGDELSQVENLIGSSFSDSLTGEGGTNQLSGGNGADTLFGESGGDLLLGGAGADSLDGGIGEDTATYVGSTAGVNINLGANAASGGHAAGDTLAGVEHLIASNHADTITGNGNANSLVGSFGTDRLTGGGSGDTLDGGGGSDTLSGNGGDDSLVGGAVGDLLFGGAGGDTLEGGDGNDTVSYANAADAVTVDRLEDTNSAGDADGDSFDLVERFALSNFGDRYVGAGAADSVSGGAGGDTLLGGAGADTLRGGDGADSLQGESNNDRLVGDEGADALDGGAGRDVLVGGAGADRFVFADVAHSPSVGSDAITGFSGFAGGAGEGDLIDLDAIDAIAGGTDDAFDYTGSNAFTGQSGELVFRTSGGNGIVLGDVDGDRQADLRIVLQGVTVAPAVSDIML